MKTRFKLNKINCGWYRYACHDITRDLEFGWSVYNGSNKIGHGLTLRTCIKAINKIIDNKPIHWQDSFWINK